MPNDAQKAAFRQSLVSLPLTCLAMALLLFVPAGTFDWARGWIFVIAFGAGVVISVMMLWRLNPEIFAARARVQPGTEKLDYLFIALVVAGIGLILPVAGWDFRARWSHMPDWLVALGYLLLLIGFAGVMWPQATSRHFEPGIRIQSDRGHVLMDRGPYAIVRHPGYSAAVMLAAGMALCLGSWWALLPASVAAAALIPRTLFEERVLTGGLSGYADYKKRVRYRWLPGVW